jgi:uncharacterized protein YjdB
MTHATRRIRLAAITALIALAGCGDGAVAPPDLPDSPGADAARHDNGPAIRWTMSFSSRLEVGQTMRIGVRYYDARGRAVSSRVVKYTSSDPSHATVDGSGLVHAISVGGTTITARAGNLRSRFQLAVVPAAESASRVVISLPDSTVAPGATMRASAVALDASGKVVNDDDATWSMVQGAPNVATVDASGEVKAIAPGQAIIAATVLGVRDTAVLTVAATQSSPSIAESLRRTDAGGNTLAIGQPVQLTIEALDEADAVISGKRIAYASSAPGIVTVTAAGLMTGVAEGSATITASADSASLKLPIVVTPQTSTTPPPSTGSPPPPTGSGIAVAVQRFDGGSGSVLVSNASPLPKGFLFPADARKVRVYVNGAEQSVYSEALKGLHADGSLRSVLVQFQYAVPSSGSVAGQVVLGQARGTTDLAKPSANRSLLTAVALPTDVNYLLSTEINGPTTSMAASKALGGAYTKYENDFVKFANLHWSTNGAAWGENYYDRALIYYAFWVRSGNPEYFRRASLLAVNYRRDYLERNSYRSSPHWSQLEGLEQHYLLTGDEASRKAIGSVAAVFSQGYYSKLSDHTVSPWMESRIQARVLQSFLLAWRVQAPGPSWTSLLDGGLTKVLSTQSADGSYRFPNTCNQSLNYMNGLLNDVLIKYYRGYRRDSRIPDAIRRSLDFLWTQWMASQAGFAYISADCLNLSGVWVGLKTAAPDLNNFIVTGFSWYGRFAGDASYSQKAELIFSGGVNRAFLQGSKQFNEEYSASFRHLGFR